MDDPQVCESTTVCTNDLFNESRVRAVGRNWSIGLLPWLFVLSFASCASSSTDEVEPPSVYSYEYQTPEATGDGWATADLTDAGLDTGPFIELMEDLHGLDDHLVHSVVVVRGGRLVFEEYFPGQKVSLARYTGGVGFDRDDTHNLASVTKSITSTLVGLAFDRGYIDSLQTPAFDFFPEYETLVDDDPRRGSMTLEHLLLMTAGLAWNDETVPYTEPHNDLVRMFNSDDPIGFALSTDLFAAPGAEFEYCNANTNILGVVVERATGQRLEAFSASALFSPLGIGDFEWQVVSPEMFFASGDLRLRPRDMAKIGQLFLEQGMWGDERVLSAEWVQAATARIVIPDGPHSWGDGYRYGWWHLDLQGPGGIVPAYAASGWGGQWIFVIPEYDVVFVTTGGAYWAPIGLSAQQMLQAYVFRAIH